MVCLKYHLLLELSSSLQDSVRFFHLFQPLKHFICAPTTFSCAFQCGLYCSLLTCVLLVLNPWTGARQAPLSMGFPRQEYWSGLPFPSPGNLPNPGIKPGSPALQADPLPSEPPGKPSWFINDSYSELPFQSPDFQLLEDKSQFLSIIIFFTFFLCPTQVFMHWSFSINSLNLLIWKNLVLFVASALHILLSSFNPQISLLLCCLILHPLRSCSFLIRRKFSCDHFE